MASGHTWRFFRAGGFDQVRLDTGADLMAIDELDQKLWVALACPTTGLDFDAKTLSLIDTDADGRIRAPELIAAVKWAGARLKNPDDLLKCAPELPLGAINESTPEGMEVLASARQILTSFGKNAAAITLEDTTDTGKIFAQTRFNGDGVIPADSGEDDSTQAVIRDMVECVGSEMDRSGKPGVSQEKVNQFFAEAQTYSDWWKRAETDAAVLPFGPSTEAAAATLRTIRAKVDDYFTRCRLAAFHPRAANALNPEEKDYLLFAAKDLRSDSCEIALFPLAEIGADKPLPLRESLNPSWAGAMAKFETDIVRPLFHDNKISITDSEWATITAKLAPYETWSAAKAGAAVEKLGLSRVREILAGNSKETITALIAMDKALEPEFRAISEVEKLVRYYRDLYRLMNNFVSFRDFYSRKDKAVFQAGTLYLDQRSCDLCMRVGDPAKHAVMAGLSGTYLAYCDCVRKGSGEQMQIVAAITAGDSDNLMVGRNGIFYDRQGRDWDATISKIIDNPISTWQAFWAPYKKAVRMVQQQISKRAAAADQTSTARLAQNIDKIEQAGAKGPVAPQEPPKKMDPGMIAALGVGAAGMGGMVGGFLTGFLNLKGLMPLGILAIILIISGPSMILAWLKLRKRNLGPILDANGWAVNAMVKINLPFGASLTRIAALPPGTQRDLIDPFAEKKRPWGWYFVVLLIILLAFGWAFGKFDGVLSSFSPKITSSWIIHHQPPPGSVGSSPRETAPAEQKK